MNLSNIPTNIIPLYENNWELTNNCIDWCRNATIIHENNLELNAMVIPIAAACSLLLHYIIINHSEFIISKTDLTEAQLERACLLSSEFALYLLIGFFIWFKWFK